MPQIGVTQWDQVEARRLYDAMAPLSAIALAVGCTHGQVSAFASRHWPTRDKAAVVQAPRDNAASPAVLARRLAHSRKQYGGAGQTTLPPLPSLAEDA